MNGSPILGIIACGLLVGAAMFAVLRFLQKEPINNTETTNHDTENNKKQPNVATTEITLSESIKETNDDLEATKSQAANAISNRHKAAAEYMKDSMNQIYEEDNTSDENEEAFDSMLKKIDNLSGEI